VTTKNKVPMSAVVACRRGASIATTLGVRTVTLIGRDDPRFPSASCASATTSHGPSRTERVSQ
jgi:hypothetical protein